MFVGDPTSVTQSDVEIPIRTEPQAASIVVTRKPLQDNLFRIRIAAERVVRANSESREPSSLGQRILRMNDVGHKNVAIFLKLRVKGQT